MTSMKLMGAICRDLAVMPPSAQILIREVLRRMSECGWKAVLWETQRSPERAAMLAKRGTGSPRSMHIFLMAFDVVDGDMHNVGKMQDMPESYWDAPPGFWEDLEDIMVGLGITRLFKIGSKHVLKDGKANSWDKPHGQFCSVADQNKVRKMSFDQLEKYIQVRFAKQLSALREAS